MGYTAVFLQLAAKPCVVIGGGEVALRKTAALLEAGGFVSVISPTLAPQFAGLASAAALRHIAREYRRGDLEGSFLAFAATDDPSVQRGVFEEARERGVLVNVVDRPEMCDFITPAVVRRGDLQIAISTGGASPALASHLRQELESLFGPEYELLLAVMRAARIRLQTIEPDPARRAGILTTLAASGLRDRLVARDFAGADRLLAAHLGREASMAALGFTDTLLNAGEAGRTG